MKNKNRKWLLRTTFAAIIVLSVVTVGIAPTGAPVTRNLPSLVQTNEMFVVTLTQSGMTPPIVGLVSETLPEGFEYVNGSFTGKGDANYNEATRVLKLQIKNETLVSYSVNASSYEQILPDAAEFSGTYILISGDLVVLEGDVGGLATVIVDGTPPYTLGHNPAKSATGVPIDTSISVHVKDNVQVDNATIVMTVKGAAVTPVKTPVGLTELVVTYDPPGNFSEGEVVAVTIAASDMAGNAMSTDVYSFTTTTGGETGTISGKITYTSNTTGIEGVTMNLTQGGSVIESQTTDGDGNYIFIGVTPGVYSVNASKPRFWDNATAVTVTTGATTANMILWLKGDLYNDGVLDIYDVIMLRQAVVKNIPSDYRFDLYTDGTIDIYDVILLRQAIVGNVIL
jgi:hypothetical protein